MSKFLATAILIAKILLYLDAAYGESPVAVIRLPKEIEESQEITPGDPVELDGGSSLDAKVFAWRVEPPVLPNGRATFKLSEDRKKITLFSREGSYKIRLMVANDEDIADAVRIVIIGKGKITTPPTIPSPPISQPTPQPPIPQPPIVETPPQAVYGLIEVVKASVTKNIPVGQRRLCQGLAEAYRHGAESLSRGVWTPADCIKRQAELNRTIKDYDPNTWSPVFKDIANKLGEARDAGRLETARQWTAAFAELSVAFSMAYVSSSLGEVQ